MTENQEIWVGIPLFFFERISFSTPLKLILARIEKILFKQHKQYLLTLFNKLIAIIYPISSLNEKFNL